MKTGNMISIFILTCFVSACSGTFLVYKDGHAYYVGNNSKAKYNVLCESGAMEKVIETSHLSRELKDDLFKYNCSPERSREKITQLYASMTIEQRKELKTAFTKQGYSINGAGC